MTLLPCPFCGGSANFEIGLHNFIDVEVCCSVCSASGGLYDIEGATLVFENKEAAAKHWNTRK